MVEVTHGWHWYRHSGLTVRSQLELPEWAAFAANSPTGEADVAIRLAEPSGEPVEEALPQGEHAAVSFSVKDTARWRITNGNAILIEPARSSAAQALRLFTLGSAWGALGYQRGLAMLHGSAVSRNGRAVFFGGTQKQGKSTMAAALLERGAQLVSDDLVRVDPPAQTGDAMIHPSAIRLKLWQAAIDQYGLHDRIITQDLFREEKFHTRARALSDPVPLPLAAIMLLEWGKEPGLEALSGGEAVRAVLRATCYRPEMLEVMGRAEEQALLAARIVNAAHVFRLTRPRDFTRLDEVCDLVEQSLA